MVKILAQAGNSLADVYDVRGSVAGIEQLETKELPIVHEMGATVFSERVAGAISRANTGDIGQTQDFGAVALSGFAPNMTRITGLIVFVDAAARMDFIQVSARSSSDGREVPLWAWDSAADQEVNLRIVDNGAAAANVTLLRTFAPNANIPTTLYGSEQRRSIDEIAMRGRTLTFGAGTVEATVLILTAFASLAGVSSRGLPMPSW